MHRSPRFTDALAILSAFASTLFAQVVFAAATDPGALISMSMNSTVGVLLDEIPAGALRDTAAANALAQGSDFWAARAARQTKLAYYRLVFRGEYYPNYKSNQKGPLPLPDKSKWNIVLTGPVQRVTTANLASELDATAVRTREIASVSKQEASLTIPSWNHILQALRELDLLRQAVAA